MLIDTHCHISEDDFDDIDGIDEDWVEEDFLMTKGEAYNKFFSSYITPDFDLNLNNLQ